MKKVFFVFIFLALANVSFSQETKPAIIYFEDTRQIKEQYSVLKENPTIRHGLYIQYFPASEEEYKELRKLNSDFTGFTKEKGNYLNGKREGEWIEYGAPGIIASQGMYTNDKKSGIWSSPREQGDVTERYDHDRDKKLPPRISLHVSYPASAKKDKVEGIVSVSYQVHPDCSISDIAIVQSLNPACDSMMVKAIENYAVLYQKYSFDCVEVMETKDFRFSLKEKD